jgi:hypothetical protein
MKWIRAVKQWFARRKLVAALLVLTLATLTAELCIKFSVPLHDGNPAEFTPMPTLVDDDIRDPQRAMKYGIRGYVELTPQDSPPQAMKRGETWTTTLVFHFVSHTPDLTEVQLDIGSVSAYPVPRPGTYYYREDGEKARFDFTSLVSYSPGGRFRLRAGETLTVQMMYRVPLDCPESIKEVYLGPWGIKASDGEEGHIQVIPTFNSMWGTGSIVPTAQ